MSLNSTTPANEFLIKDDVDADIDIIEGCIARIADNDKDALAELYHITNASVYGFALSIVKNTYDAEMYCTIPICAYTRLPAAV